MLTFIKCKTESMTNLVAHTSKFLSFLDNMKCKSCLARSFFPIDFNHSSLQSARQISKQSCLEDFSKFMAQLKCLRSDQVDIHRKSINIQMLDLKLHVIFTTVVAIPTITKAQH